MKTAKIIAVTFLLVSGLLLSACGGGGGGSSSGGGSQNRADASIDPVSGPLCKGANTVTKSSTAMKCDWHCAEYNGEVGFVSLFFIKTGGEWVLEDSFIVTPGQC